MFKYIFSIDAAYVIKCVRTDAKCAVSDNFLLFIQTYVVSIDYVSGQRKP